jgi:hypothetical protein
MTDTRNYSSIALDRQSDAAIDDVRGYLGDKFSLVTDYLGQGIPRDTAALMLSMAGIAGYPATVMIERYWKE